MNGLEAAVSPSIFFLGHRLTLCLSVCILFTSVYSILLFLLPNILYLTIVFISLSPELQMASACHIPISYNLPASTSSVNWPGVSVVLSSKSLGRNSNYPSLSFFTRLWVISLWSVYRLAVLGSGIYLVPLTAVKAGVGELLDGSRSTNYSYLDSSQWRQQVPLEVV